MPVCVQDSQSLEGQKDLPVLMSFFLFYVPRLKLADTPFIADHAAASNNHKPKNPSHPSQLCAHIYLHPLKWMRPCLFPESEESPLTGRLTCPGSTCGANIGKFSWQGMPCSCGIWVTPAIALARSRVDVMSRAPTRVQTGFQPRRFPVATNA